MKTAAEVAALLTRLDMFPEHWPSRMAAETIREQAAEIEQWRAVTARNDPDDCSAGIKMLYDNWQSAKAAEREIPREPTQAMVTAAMFAIGSDTPYDTEDEIRAEWRAMYDAAIQEARPEPAGDAAALMQWLENTRASFQVVANRDGAMGINNSDVALMASKLGEIIAALAAQAAAAERYWPYVEAVAKQRFPFSHADIIDAVEMLRERKKAAIAASAPPSAESGK